MACMVCPTVFAQDNHQKYELFFGYSLMKLVDEYSDIDDEREWLNLNGGSYKKSSFLEKGFAASFTYNFAPAIGLETAFRYNSGYILSEKWKEHYLTYVENHETGYKKSDFSFLIGPRVTFKSGHAAPFVHGLVGLSHDKIAYAYDLKWEDSWGNRDSESESDTLNSNNSLAFALGGGLDILIHENVALRVFQADYYITNHPSKLYGDTGDIENERRNNINLSFGIVFRFGK